MVRTSIASLAFAGLLFTGCDSTPSGGGDDLVAGGVMGGGGMSPDPDPMPSGGTQAPDPGDEVEVADVLARLANELVLPTFVQFAEKSATLEGAAEEWAAAPGDVGLRDAARTAWLDAVFTWQHAELMQIGPAGAVGKRVGGDDLRDRIYSWPSTRTCRIDQALLAAEFREANWLDGALFEVQGLDALEYLLYTEQANNACPAAVRINRDGLWEMEFAEMPVLTARRAEFSAVLAGGVRSAADELVSAFAADGGRFVDALAGGVDPYTDAANALNEVYAALFYIDKLMKDAKLGRALGIAEGCDEARCPEAFESRHSGRGAAHLLANLESFEAMFFGIVEGQDGPGFDDLLAARDGAAVAARMADNIAAARVAIEGLGDNLAGALEETPEGVEAAHAAIKTVTDDFKGDVVTILDLEVPREGAGDSD